MRENTHKEMIESPRTILQKEVDMSSKWQRLRRMAKTNVNNHSSTLSETS